MDYTKLLQAAGWMFIGSCYCNGTKKDEFVKNTTMKVYPMLGTFREWKVSLKLTELENYLNAQE